MCKTDTFNKLITNIIVKFVKKIDNAKVSLPLIKLISNKIEDIESK